MFLRTQSGPRSAKGRNLLGKQCWMFLKFSFTLQHKFGMVYRCVCLWASFPYSLNFIMSSQIFINAHCIWMAKWFLYTLVYLRRGRGSKSKYCLDFTRHNSMFISIIFLTWFRLCVRSLLRSFALLSFYVHLQCVSGNTVGFFPSRI